MGTSSEQLNKPGHIKPPEALSQASSERTDAARTIIGRNNPSMLD